MAPWRVRSHTSKTFLLVLSCYHTSAEYTCLRNPATRYLLIMAGIVEVLPPNMHLSNIREGEE